MLKRHWPALLVTAVALPIVSPFLVAPPLSHDHPIRLFQAWNFWTEMLGRGRLRGWSQFYGFGYPAGELYPFGAEAWVALVRIATLGRFDWMRTYGIALGLALVVAALGTLSFTRRHFGAGAGVVAAASSLVDPGGWAEGGWFWHTEFGVWPVTLAMGLVLFALAKLTDVMSQDRRRDVVIAGALIAASLLTHLLPLTVYPIVVPLLVLDRWLRAGWVGPAALLRLLAACLLGVGLAAFSVIPMMARTNLTLDLGVQGVSLDELGRRIGDANVFSGMWPPLFALGMIGAALAVADPRKFRPFAPLAASIALLLSSDILIHDLHLERLMAGLIKIEARRFVLVAKLFWFPLIGHAVATILRLTVLREVVEGRARRNRRLAIGLLCSVTIPFALPAARQLYRAQVEKHIQTPAQTPYWADLSHLFEWSAELRRTSREFYRIAYALPMHDHLSGIAPVFDRTLFYKVGYTPAGIFNRFPMSGEPALLEALSVKFLVTDHDVDEPSFTLERSFGALRVYRFNRFRSEPFVLIGEGHASLQSFEAETIRIGLEGIKGPSRLRLSVASFPCWRATLNGVELPITTVAVHDAEFPILMEVPAGDGQLEFHYVRRAIDWLGLGITLLTLASLAGALFHGEQILPRFARTLGEQARNIVAEGFGSRAAAVAMASGACGLVVVGAVLWERAKPPLPAGSLFKNGAAITLSLAGVPCRLDGFAAWKCGDQRVEPGVNSGLYGAHVCMSAPPVGPLVVGVLGKVPSFVAGRYDPGGDAGQIRVELAGRTIGQMSTRDAGQGLQFFQFDTRPGAGRFETLRVTLEGAPLHCFDVSLVP